MPFDFSFFALAYLAVLLIGVSKAGFGGAMGSLAVPLLSLVIPVPQAAAILLPILLLLDAIGLVVFRGKADRTNLMILLPSGLLGLLLGAIFFHSVSLHIIQAVIGIEAILFGFNRFFHAKTAVVPKPASVPLGVFFGSLSGFTSFISHAGGPPLLHFLLPQGLERTRMAATSVFFFSFINFAKIIPFFYLGLFDTQNLNTSLWLLPMIPVSYFIGMKCLKRLPQTPFFYVMSVALILTGVKLLADALL